MTGCNCDLLWTQNILPIIITIINIIIIICKNLSQEKILKEIN